MDNDEQKSKNDLLDSKTSKSQARTLFKILELKTQILIQVIKMTVLLIRNIFTILFHRKKNDHQMTVILFVVKLSILPLLRTCTHLIRD